MILKYLRPRDWGLLAICSILAFGQVYFDLRIPQYMQEITNHLQMGDDTGIVVSCGVDMILCACASLVMAVVAAVLAARVSAALCRTLREEQFSSIGRWSRADLDSFSVASLITRSTNDVYQLQQFMARAITMVFRAPLLAILAIFKIMTSSFEWTSVTIVAMVILLISFYSVMYRGIPYIRKGQWFVDNVNSETRDALEGMHTIRAYNAEGRQTDEFERSSNDLLRNSLKAVHIMSPLHAIVSSMSNFLILAIYLVGASLIHAASTDTEQMLLFSDMIVFTSYATMVLSGVMMAAGVFRQMPNIMVSSKRIQDVIDYKPSMTEGTLTMADALEPSTVSFENVSFSYPGSDRMTIENVSFTVRSGETLAIVGPTASGKSTLVNLIPRLYDATEGTVKVGGVDVKEYRFEELHRMLGYVPQKAVVFSGSMKDNICYGEDSEKSDSNALDAITVAQLTELLSRLPEGLDSDISQYGWNLSGGQKQRVSIARAVSKHPPIYIFDDTFSALDAKTDRDLRMALAERTENATKIVVAQRIGTILDADKILVMEHGRIIASGKHSELMENCELYREIAKSQLEDFDDA